MSVHETQYAVPCYAHIQISEDTINTFLMAFIPVYCIAEGIGFAIKSFSQVFEGFEDATKWSVIVVCVNKGPKSCGKDARETAVVGHSPRKLLAVGALFYECMQGPLSAL